MSGSVFRIHPAIGIARVGDSEEFYLGPETMAGFPVVPGSEVMGGLPIKAGTEDELITSRDIRDANGALKRQAARFRIYRYPEAGEESYPTGQGVEVAIGSVVDGRKVVDIAWTVHLANKKANWYLLNDDCGIAIYEPDGCGSDHQKPVPRNLQEGGDLDDPNRLRRLMIDAGPRAVHGAGAGPVRFDRTTEPAYWKAGTGSVPVPDYPVSFPDQNFPRLSCPGGGGIDTLGELRTDGHGRLLVVAAYGRACAWYRSDGQPYPLDDDVNNDGWFDDVADGPVQAVLIFEDGTQQPVQGSAWVVTTDPGYAPQTLNVVSLWDDVFDTWVRKLDLRPDIYRDGSFVQTYEPVFGDEVYPIFRAAQLQQWNTNLNDRGREQHDAVGAITADQPGSPTLLKFVRNPSDPGDDADPSRMPLSLGDAGHSFLSPSITQYFFLTRWAAGRFRKGGGAPLGPGELLDKVVLANCLGGRFSPGIEMTFICRDPDLYRQDWRTSGAGPFRIAARPLDYGSATRDRPFLTVGYVPLSGQADTVEPGDVSKFMAIPWHTDYNSCATHPTMVPDPVVPGRMVSTGHYWSWPAERPVAVYAAADVKTGQLGPQRFSVRGPGTFTTDQDEMGRFQDRLDMVRNWQNIGVIVQGTAIEEGAYPADFYLEVQSRLENTGNTPLPWPDAGSAVAAGGDS